MKKNPIFILTIFFLITSTAIIGQKDSSQVKKDKGPKEYADLITEDALTDEGLFAVHQVNDKYYFEIPDDLLEKEILVVSRISGFVKNLNFGGAGMKSRPQQVIRFQKKGDNIILRSVSYNSVASEDDPIYNSVVNNNFEPVIQVLSIAATGKEKNSSIIEVNPLFTKDVAMIGALRDSQRKN
ncbi:MAG: DUF5118 domain-containing protein, partial [Saprospiraceae bacterium]|nr:DUF5118 domain-containing protein [Saprospiraceae bacterium]